MRDQQRGKGPPPARPRRAKKERPGGGAVDSVHAFADARTDDDRLRALELAAREGVPLPADAFVIGEPVVVVAIQYLGHPRAGLAGRCVRGGREFTMGLADVVFPPGSRGAAFVDVYRGWLGLGDPGEQDAEDRVETANERDVASDAIPVGKPVELAVLAVKSGALRCRLLGTSREVTLRTSVRDEVPGAVITVIPSREWKHVRHPYLAGKVVSMRVEVAALGLVPLALTDAGFWDPREHRFGDEGEAQDPWVEAIIAQGRRPMYEMEQVLPGGSSVEDASDPIADAAELLRSGDSLGARELLMRVLAADLRCLDAHAHLGNAAFRYAPEEAQRHFEIGMRIGGLSLGEDFEGVLPWGFRDNRPYLRCRHGFGLCAWRQGDFRTAAEVFRSMLWLNPMDNQGARFVLAAVEAGTTWEKAGE